MSPAQKVRVSPIIRISLPNGRPLPTRCVPQQPSVAARESRGRKDQFQAWMVASS